MSTRARSLGRVYAAVVARRRLTAFARQGATPLAPLVVPAGFQVDVFAENVENARAMALGPQGTVFVGSQ